MTHLPSQHAVRPRHQTRPGAPAKRAFFVGAQQAGSGHDRVGKVFHNQKIGKAVLSEASKS